MSDTENTHYIELEENDQGRATFKSEAALTYSEHEEQTEMTVTETQNDFNETEAEEAEHEISEGGPEEQENDDYRHKLEIHERIGIAYKQKTDHMMTKLLETDEKRNSRSIWT